MAIKLTRALRVGRSGPDVSALQRALRDLGYAISVDGSFGAETRGVVRAFQADHDLVVDGVVDVGERTERAINAALEASRPPTPILPSAPRDRGVVVQLTDDQRVTRARYLAGEVPLSALDHHVRRDAETLRLFGYTPSLDQRCLDLFYLLQEHNGGQDPTAPDPAVRWCKPSSTFVNRTVDCSGANAWVDGVDRYQPRRMAAAVGYDGWFNTDSKIIDARRVVTPRSGRRCYEDAGRPYSGATIVCASGSPGHDKGHEGRVTGYRGDHWDPRDRACWDMIDVVDCAERSPARTNARTTGRGWFGTGAMFLRCVMAP